MIQQKNILATSLLLFIVLISSNLKGDDILRRKIGQMIMVGFTGNSLSLNTASVDSLKHSILYQNLGGVILMTVNSNLQNPEQIKFLTDSLQLLAGNKLFISTDQEGGKVARLGTSNGFQKTNTAFTLGTLYNSIDSTKYQSKLMAGWLKQSGINMNLAPVADVNVNPLSPAIGALERSFSSDTLVVYNHTKAFIEEFHNRNILTVLKHFPGHGSAANDSHLGFTDITQSWNSYELFPFSKLVSDSIADLIMTGHLFNAQIDSLFPATLSNSTITGLLRNKIKFNGVVISDAMGMQAISSNYSFDSSVYLAVYAGVDILLYTSNLDKSPEKNSIVTKIIDIIESKVLSGEISESRINESYSRIQKLKNKYLLPVKLTEGLKILPDKIKLYQNFPNPFNQTTILRFEVPALAMSGYQKVSLKIYDILGNLLETIVDDELIPGVYQAIWETSKNHKQYCSGTYIYKINIGNYQETKKMILIK